jgi:hypothetical protein
MVMNISAIRAGLVLGALLGAWHLCWAILVAVGAAQTIIDFVFWMHFIKPVFLIEPFDGIRAALLIGVTGALGFVIGATFAVIWNALHKT